MYRKMNSLLAVTAFLLISFVGEAGEKTFVYVSNSVGGSISIFEMEKNGKLANVGEMEVAPSVMPMAISPDRRFLYASIRSQPYSVASYAIDSSTGQLDLLSIVPTLDSMVHISTDRTGRFLLGASYGGDIITSSPIGPEGFAQAEPISILRIGRHAHAILADPSNRFAYVTNLSNDQIVQMLFDEDTGALTLNKPATVAVRPEAGPRHFCFSPNNRFVFVLNELNGTVTTLALDADTGLLSERSSASVIKPGTDIVPGSARAALGQAATALATDADNRPVIWAADIQITPNGKFIYASERTTSTLACFAADTLTGKLTYVGSVETEKQPRGFKIDPKGRFLICSGEKADHISVYLINQDNGELTLLERYATGKNPNWVEIVNFR